MPYDPALTAIAVATNDALTEPLWRHDTGDTDHGDPIAHIAVELHRAAHDFNTTTDLLTRLLAHVGELCRRHTSTITDLATIYPHSLDSDTVRLVQQLERFDTQRETLLKLYGMWRRYRHTTRDPRARHLLVQPYDPSKGMVALSSDETGLGWFVAPDQVAAEVHGLSTYGVLVGGIWHGSAGWQATAFTHPEHRATCPHLVYPLPPADTEAAACRALLRWWALRDSEQWHGRTPAELTAAEQAALVA
ncbi:hypothetical protein [Micromonospora sp. WMMD1082]|uniref:hypothetical protein n=1 Tax=Micromonospora sp. WMMD1082 TaxID=3016104 RepID=UPI0024170DCA|nr:hypothetical protein [Micromonospora sp. WMMD1082]MDG4793640.1 hypothetical protein [Micromonospora sp. WMMD1082]